MPVVRLGHANGNVTVAHIPDSYSRRERFDSITARDGVWANHTDKDPSQEPVWISSSDPALEESVAIFFECARGEPAAGGQDHEVVGEVTPE